MSDPSTPTSTDTGKKSKSKSQRSVVATELSMITLQVLKDVAEASPIPGLGAIPSLAMEIFTAVQNARDNKDALKRLANDAYSVATAVVEGCKDMEANGQNLPQLQQQLGTLQRTMEAIADFAKDRARRNPFLRMATSRNDATTIQDYRQQLQHAMDLFATQSHINVRIALNRVENLLKKQSESAEVPLPSPISFSESPSTPTQNPFRHPSTLPPLNTDIPSHSAPPSLASPTPVSSPFSMFANSQNTSITGHITMNNVSGNQTVTTNNVNNSNVNTGNVYHQTRYNTYASPALRHMSVPGYNPGYWRDQWPHNIMGSHQNIHFPGASRGGRGSRQTYDNAYSHRLGEQNYSL